MKYCPAVLMTLAVSIGFTCFASELNLDENGLALSGYDPVEYLQYNHALKGFTDIEANLDGVRYRFRNWENRERFITETEKYLPAYGGWCAYSLAMDESEYPRGKYPVDPKTFKIIDGRLYLFYNQEGFNALHKWNQEETRYRPIADREWAALNKQG